MGHREGISGHHKCPSSQIQKFFPLLGISRRAQVLYPCVKVLVMTRELTRASPSSSSAHTPPWIIVSTLWLRPFVHPLPQLPTLTSTNVSLMEDLRRPIKIFKNFIIERHKMLDKRVYYEVLKSSDAISKVMYFQFCSPTQLSYL